MEPILIKAIQDYQNRKLSSMELGRLLIAHDEWDCLIREGQGLQNTDNDDQELEIYLNRSIAAQVLIQSSDQHLIQELKSEAGLALFKNLDTDIRQLRVITGLHPALVYSGDRILELQNLALSLEIENMFEDLQNGFDKEILKCILDFSRYCVLVLELEHGLEPLIAPGYNELEYVSVFCAQDALDLYLKWLQKQIDEQAVDLDLAELSKVQMDGHELFARLSKQNHDGFVLNPLGPCVPVVVKKEFYKLFQKVG